MRRRQGERAYGIQGTNLIARMGAHPIHARISLSPMDKKLDIDVLVGSRFLGWALPDPKRLILWTDKANWVVQVEDEGDCGNDSYACVTDVDLTHLLNQTITAAHHEADERITEDYSEKDVTRLVLEAGDARGVVIITHFSNGYYGYSYELVPYTHSDHSALYSPSSQ